MLKYLDLNFYMRLRSRGWQQKEIASKLGLSPNDISNFLVKQKEFPSVCLTSDETHWIESSLIGDGSIVPDVNGARFSITTANKVYCNWWLGVLASWDFKTHNIKPFLLSKEKSGYNKDCWHFFARTRTSSVLCGLRERWYPGGVKVLPLDFQWDLLSLSILIAEDGSRANKGSIIYWGVKSDESFDLLKKFLDGKFLYSEHKRHISSGRSLYIRNTGILFKVPGYEHKFVEG